MALEKIPAPGDDAFKNAFLDKDYGKKVVRRLNRTTKVVADGRMAGKVLETEDNMTIDLSMMLIGEPAYVINNGELRYARVVIQFLNDPNA